MTLAKFPLRQRTLELSSQLVVPITVPAFSVRQASGANKVYLSEHAAKEDARQQAVYAARKEEKDFYGHQIVNVPKLELPLTLVSNNSWRDEKISRKLVLCVVKNKVEAKAFALSHKPTGRRYVRRHPPYLVQAPAKGRVMMCYVDEEGSGWRSHTVGPYRLPVPDIPTIEKCLNLIVDKIDNGYTQTREGAANVPPPSGVTAEMYERSSLFNPTELMAIGGMFMKGLPVRLPTTSHLLINTWLKAHVKPYCDKFIVNDTFEDLSLTAAKLEESLNPAAV